MSDYLLALSDIYFIINMVGRMLYRYSELLKNEKFNTDRKIKVALSEKRLFKLDCGFYSFDSRCSELEFIMDLLIIFQINIIYQLRRKPEK